MQEEISYTNGRTTHTITVVPKVNLTVSCSVSNKLGEDTKTINVSSGKLPAWFIFLKVAEVILCSSVGSYISYVAYDAFRMYCCSVLLDFRS